MLTRLAFVFAALVGFSFAPLATAAEPRVEFEVCTEEGFAITEARDWSEMLGQLGLVNVRIRGAKGGDSPAIQTLTSGGTTIHHVVGILTSGGVLKVPQGSFRLTDKARLAQWIAKLKTGGEEGVTTQPAAFGLLPRELVAVHEALAVPVGFGTKGKKPREVSKQIAEKLSLKFIADSPATAALAADEPVADELQGLASGTVLAAVLRPLGLVMFPEKNGTEIRLRIADSRAAAEHWPVGWPPQGNPHETLPELFKFLNVEIADTSLAEALPAIGERVKAPLVLDYNALARLEIDLAAKKVGIPKTNTFYGKILDRLLFQANLKYEVRVDEADKPLLWISAIRQ